MDLTLDIQQKLNSWVQEISLNPLLFENPATNFLLLKMLRYTGRYDTKLPQETVQNKCENSNQKWSSKISDYFEWYDGNVWHFNAPGSHHHISQK